MYCKALWGHLHPKDGSVWGGGEKAPSISAVSEILSSLVCHVHRIFKNTFLPFKDHQFEL